jgi:hypothetical protein
MPSASVISRLAAPALHPHADPAFRHQQVKQPGHRQPESNDHQPISRVEKATHFDRARKSIRRIQQHWLRAPDHAYRFIGNQDQGKGGQHLRQVIAFVQLTEQ